MWDGEVVSRQAHILEIGGANPPPATNREYIYFVLILTRTVIIENDDWTLCLLWQSFYCREVLKWLPAKELSLKGCNGSNPFLSAIIK